VMGAEAPRADGDRLAVVGCGRSLVGEAVAIVDPDDRHRLAKGNVGEVWVSGPNVAQGYWQNVEATHETFAGEIAGEPGMAWLRTGDLGFLDADGELFITGRIKDVIILRGANHYPQDIEHTVQRSDASLRPGFGAAFAVNDESGHERVIVVQEVERTQRNKIDVAEVMANIREAVAEEHEISVHEVVLIAPGNIPKTTSGKIQRRLTRQLWQDNALERVSGSQSHLPDSSTEGSPR